MGRPYRFAEWQRRACVSARPCCCSRVDPVHPLRLVCAGRRRHLHHHQQLRLRSGHSHGRIGRPSTSAGCAHAVAAWLDCLRAHDCGASRPFGHPRSAYAGPNDWRRFGRRHCWGNGRGGMDRHVCAPWRAADCSVRVFFARFRLDWRICRELSAGRPRAGRVHPHGGRGADVLSPCPGGDWAFRKSGWRGGV